MCWEYKKTEKKISSHHLTYIKTEHYKVYILVFRPTSTRQLKPTNCGIIIHECNDIVHSYQPKILSKKKME